MNTHYTLELGFNLDAGPVLRLKDESIFLLNFGLNAGCDQEQPQWITKIGAGDCIRFKVFQMTASKTARVDQTLPIRFWANFNDARNPTDRVSPFEHIAAEDLPIASYVDDLGGIRRKLCDVHPRPPQSEENEDYILEQERSFVFGSRATPELNRWDITEVNEKRPRIFQFKKEITKSRRLFMSISVELPVRELAQPPRTNRAESEEWVTRRRIYYFDPELIVGGGD